MDNCADRTDTVTPYCGHLLEGDDRVLLRRGIEVSLSGYAIARMDGTLTYVNGSMLRLWGYNSPEEMLGRNAAEFWRSPEEARALMAELLCGRIRYHEMTAQRKDGSLFTAQLTATAVPDNSGAPVALMGSFIDVTETRAAEAKALKLSRLACIASMASDLSHDLNNVLTTVCNNLYLAKTYAPFDAALSLEKIEAALSTLSEAGESLRQMTALTKTLEPAEGGDDPLDSAPQRARVLVMDDEWLLCKTVVELLGLLGLEAEAALEGEGAVSKYTSALAAGRPFDAVVLDINVYSGMGGVEAAKLLRQADPRAHLIACTGMRSEAVIAEGMMALFDDLIIKPYDATEIFQRVTLRLAQKKAPGSVTA